MPISAQERIIRRDFIGSSDIAAILGQDPNHTILDVYVSKAFEVAESETDNEALELGNDFEVPLLRWAGRHLAVEIEPNVRTEKGRFASNHDALIVDRDEGLEAKVRTYDPREFGTEGTDEIPPRVILQCQCQCYTGDLARVHVPVMLPWNGRLSRRLYTVARSEKLIAHMIAAGERFWREHVEVRRPPEGVRGNVELFKRIEREVGTMATVDAALVEEWEAAKIAAKLYDDDKEQAFVRLLAQVGDADGWEWGDPAGTYYTYFEYGREDLDAKRLKAEEPELAQAYLRQGTYRTAYKRKASSGRRSRRR